MHEIDDTPPGKQISYPYHKTEKGEIKELTVLT